MASKSTRFKQVVVKEIPRTSLAEAGIFNLTLPDGSGVVAVANMLWPHHDRNLVEMVKRYIADTQPAVVIMLGQMVDHEAFKSLTEDEKNYLRKPVDMPEVIAARAAGNFDDQLTAMRRAAGEFIASFAIGKTKVLYTPGVRTEHKLMEWAQQEKMFRDNWTSNHPEASDQPSDPNRTLPTDFARFLYLKKSPRVRVLDYESGLLINGHTLYVIGDYKRRHPGDASYLEWEQRGYNIVRSFNGSLASGWHTTSRHTQPELNKAHHQAHEIGYLWDDVLNGHLRDYDVRAQGFFSGEYRMNELFGAVIEVIRGNDGKRSFLGNNFQMYSEDDAGGLPKGGSVSLDDEPTFEDEDWHLPGDEGDGEDVGETEAAAPAAVEAAPAPEAPAQEKPVAKKRVRSTTAKKKPAAKRKPRAK